LNIDRRGYNERVTDALTVVDPPLPDAVLVETATATRAGFTGADLLPGLPRPDGLFETAESLAADLAAGAWMCLARDPRGAITGGVRAFTRRDGNRDPVWEVRRLAIVPQRRGTGLARALMRRLEDAARDAGAVAVTLDTVVERGNPAFYARLGYRTLAHIPTPDKPLSEVSMRRELDVPAAPLAYPWDGEQAPRDYRLVVTWHTDGTTTIARVHRDVDDVLRLATGHDFAGADGWRDADPAAEAIVRRWLGAMRYAGRPEDVPAYRMPRRGHPDLLALWRLLS
jgi:GNAT superfamily N-acetyltransferase